MIIEKVNKGEVVSEGIEEGGKMQIDMSSISILQHILSEGLYEDSITAAIVETVNNNLDSIIMSGKDPIENPVIVSIYQENDNFFFSSKDTGLGLDEDEFKDLIGFYLKSTKRASSTTTGYFGLGKFAPLSYTDSFYWVCRKEGKERKFIVYKGEEFTEYNKIYEKDTEEPNGVEVIIPLKNNWREPSDFLNKAKKKLAYYDTVVIIHEGKALTDYKIYREEEFQFSTLWNYPDMHMCLKDVYYALDWDKLGITPINLPVALRFGLSDHILPTPSREGIIYNKETKELIKDKIERVCKWFIDKYNEETTEGESFKAIYSSLNPYNVKQLTLHGQTFNISNIKDYGVLKEPKLKSIELLDLRRVYDKSAYLLKHYTNAGEVDYNLRYRRDAYFIPWSQLLNSRKLILIEEKPGNVLMDYIKDTYGACSFVRKHEPSIKLKEAGNKETWYNILGLNKQDKKDWRQLITEWKKIEESLEKEIIDVKTIIPTDEWLEERKLGKKKGTMTLVSKEEINPRYGEYMSSNNSDFKVKYEPISPKKICDFDTNTTYVYGLIDDRKRLEVLYEYLRNNVTVVVLVQRDIKRIEEASLSNWITVDEYMEGKLEHFGKFCTAVLVNRLMTKNNVVNANIKVITKINPEFVDQWKIMTGYVEKNYHGITANAELVTDMLKICTEKDLWEKDIYDAYLEVEKEIPNFEFLKFVRTKGNNYYSSSSEISEECHQFVIDYYNNFIKGKTEEVKEEVQELDLRQLIEIELITETIN